MTRTVKSARQKAEEALGVSERKIAKAKAKRDDLASQVKALDVEIAAEEKQRAWIATSPALGQSSSEPPVVTEPAAKGTPALSKAILKDASGA